MLLTTHRYAKALQLTLAVIKPNAVAHPVIMEALHQKILENNFVIVRCRDLVWKRQDSEKFYEEHAGRFFYQRLVEFMSSPGPVPLNHPYLGFEAGTLGSQLSADGHIEDSTIVENGPMRAYVLGREDAISVWRELMGPTRVFRAQFTSPTTIRGQFGLTDTRNTSHGSDSLESAQREIAFFFPEFRVEEWMEKEEPSFRRGLIEYDQQRNIHTLLAHR